MMLVDLDDRVGRDVCDAHAAQQRILEAQRKLAAGAPMAADVLIDLSQNGQTEEVRRRASEAVLDRAGLRPGIEITFAPPTDGGPSVGDVLRERLALLRRRTIEGAIADAAVVDGVASDD